MSIQSELCLPDFLVIGAAKGGTTSLYHYFDQHPEIYMSPVKEPEFFADDVVYQRGLDWYAALFDEAEPGQRRGEASTIYTRWPQYPAAPERIATHLPNVKLIYVLRHPIERAFSHYVHRCAKELYPDRPIPHSFEVHIEQDPMCIDSSHYIRQIDRYLQYFPATSLLCLLSEDLERQPRQVLQQCFDFLGVDDAADAIVDQAQRANDSAQFRYWMIRRNTTAALKRIPGLNRLGRLLPQQLRDQVYQRLHRSRYGQRVAAGFTPLPMHPETRQRLIAEFRDSNARLGEFLGRDLSVWDC